VKHEGVTGVVRLEPYVLPHEIDFSSPDAFRKASGPAKWNQQQGFYIYRAGRLIQSGGWCRLRTADEHTKLVRIGLSFNPVLDEAFQINVAKMRVQLPAQIRDEIDKQIAPVIRLASDTYRRRSSADAPGPARRVTMSPVISPGAQPVGDVMRREEPPQSRRSGSPSQEWLPRPERLWSLGDLQQRLEEVSEPAEKPVVARVFARLRDRMKEG
jgi:hypothetical protein